MCVFILHCTFYSSVLFLMWKHRTGSVQQITTVVRSLMKRLGLWKMYVHLCIRILYLHDIDDNFTRKLKIHHFPGVVLRFSEGSNTPQQSPKKYANYGADQEYYKKHIVPYWSFKFLETCHWNKKGKFNYNQIEKCWKGFWRWSERRLGNRFYWDTTYLKDMNVCIWLHIPEDFAPALISV